MAATYTYADLVLMVSKGFPSPFVEQYQGIVCNLATNLIWYSYDWRESIEMSKTLSLQQTQYPQTSKGSERQLSANMVRGKMVAVPLKKLSQSKRISSLPKSELCLTPFPMNRKSRASESSLERLRTSALPITGSKGLIKSAQ